MLMAGRHRVARTLGLLGLVLLLLTLCAGPLYGQGVRGTIVETDTNRPVEGAFVTAIDEAGATVYSILTGRTGAYALHIYRAGRFRIRVERIGYETWTSPAFDLALGETLTRPLELPIQAIRLTELSITLESQCRPRPRAGAPLARVWEETRKALELARWTESQPAVRFDIRTWERQLDPNTDRIRKETSTTKEKEDRASYLSAPAEELAAEGYVRPDGEGWRFFAPDADVLLSESFGERHCFSLVSGVREDAGLVGLAFEPMARSDQGDVEGVLWLNQATNELSRLEFDYTGVVGPLREYAANGRVEFLRLPTGHWVVRNWRIRMPIPGVEEGFRLGPRGRLERRTELALGAYTEAGGEVMRVELPDGESVELAEWGTVLGSVRDSLGSRPLTGVRAMLAGTDYRATTDMEGHFRLDFVPPGNYMLSVEHPEAELYALPAIERPVTVRTDRTVIVDVAFPSRETVLSRVCPDPEAGTDFVHPEEPSIVLGFVREAGTGEPVPGARVWISYSDYWAREAEARARIDEAWTQTGHETDSSGAYWACGLPGNWDVIAQAETPKTASDTVWRRTPAGDVLRLDFELSPEREGPGVFGLDRRAAIGDVLDPRADGEQSATLLGTVKSADTKEPVGSAHIRLLGTGVEGITRGDGTFLMEDLPLGRYRVITAHLGMVSDTAWVDLRGGAVSLATLSMETRPIELPTLDVEIERTFRNPRIADFYERMRRGMGEFITAEDLELTDVVGNFRRIPGARLRECVSRLGLQVSGCWDVVITRGYVAPGTDCPPLIYMNGAPLSAPVGEAEERRRDIAGNNPFTFLQGYPRHLIEGIEVYRNPAGAPGQFRRKGDACGIVLVWTATRGR